MQRISFFALANFKNYIKVAGRNSTGILSIKTIRIGGTWYSSTTRKEVGSKITSNMVTRTPLDYNYIGSICTIFENGYESNWNFYKKMQY